MGKEGRSGQRNVMEVFRQEEEDSLAGNFTKKFTFSPDEDQDTQRESVLNRPGLGNTVFMRNRVLSSEDLSNSKSGSGFQMPRELLQRQGTAEADEAEADVEGEENGLVGGLPWVEDEIEWEEEEADAALLGVFLQSLHLGEFLPLLVREQIDLEALLFCSDEDLQNIHMQLGPRKKVLNAINRRKQALPQPGHLVDTSL
ncbi:Ankyrin repeat and SAM domain-containing protein 4B [Fukomys damarensis]|uniref:Ankyrin repeat and SAM domain-containing protein 4B n=2 Tax=Fukomys damarensis TaxID=885580 RepID=A0A091DU97_FUKDA|nr:Ankyrin repeat and SAM domain-containing protein 4B [Fukomys damarensis]